jgi:CRISPR/Cas system-associated endonuclease Cas1
MEFNKPSLVCDFEELYRHAVDDFAVEFSYGLKERDFVLKEEYFSSNRRCKRFYLNEEKSAEMTESVEKLFSTIVEVPRLKVGQRQQLESLFSEEAMRFSKYLRQEIPIWEPRIVKLP